MKRYDASDKYEQQDKKCSPCMTLITEYIDSINTGHPIFTSDIREYLVNDGVDVDPRKVNVYISRYEKNNDDFIRYAKGIYYKSSQTPFGQSSIKKNELVRRLYLEDNGEVFGYETGPSLINRLGLTTQVPKYSYFATNRHRADKVSDTIKLIKPVVEVTKDNYKYLQILDALMNKYNIEFEVDNPQKIIREVIDNNKLEFEKLLRYATLYKNREIYEKIAQVAVG